MKPRFTADFFRGNRARLKALCPDITPMIVTANGLLQRNSDSTFPFRQDSNFWYLTGIDDPDVILVIDDSKEYLIVPEQSDYQHAFDGTIEYKALSKCSGIDNVIGTQEGWKSLTSTIKKAKKVALLAAPPAYIDIYGMYTNPARRRVTDKIQRVNPGIELLDLRSYISRLRAIKQPIELRTLQEAVDLTITAVKKATNKLSKLEYEYELEAEIVQHFLRAGAYPAWKPIVAAGLNGTILHYIANRSTLKDGDLIYVDVGAEISHYTSDITRTYSIGDRLSQRQENIWEAVKEVQDYALTLLRPGVIIKEYEKQVELFMGEKLRALGLIDTIEHETVRRYYPHATSHFLGLDAHDVGDYDQPLEPNMVLTVEPGIYIPAEKIGIRIEDDILITQKGCLNLSAALAR